MEIFIVNINAKHIKIEEIEPQIDSKFAIS